MIAISTSMFPTIHPVAGRIAVFLVASILLHGFLFHKALWRSRMLKMPHSRSLSPVQVMVLSESLCIDCKRFFLGQLAETYQKLGPTVIELKVVPFGNSKYVRDETTNQTMLHCQHGFAECDADSFEQCVVLDQYPYPRRYLPFLLCLYDTLDMGHREEAFDRALFSDCARRTALDWGSIVACHDDKERAAQLQKRASKLTPNYHTEVPWVEVNGRRVKVEEDGSFLRAVCDEFTQHGGKHQACTSLPV